MTIIRPEQPGDYAAIAEVNALAFGGAAEPALVALLRQSESFMPELSLVIEEKEQVVGHVLFTPTRIRLNNDMVRAVLLAPIAIHPDHQKKGYGGALIENGHQIAKMMGYKLSFLIGHSSYYPRFGYQTHAFGVSEVTIPAADLPDFKLKYRAPKAADLDDLFGLWLHEEGAIDFAISPGSSIVDWLSPNPACKSLVFTRDKQIVGYVRGEIGKPRLFLAADHDAAREMARFFCGDGESVTLPLHEKSASVGAFNASPTFTSWEAAMVCPLTKIQYNQGGRPIWTSAFDIA